MKVHMLRGVVLITFVGQLLGCADNTTTEPVATSTQGIDWLVDAAPATPDSSVVEAADAAGINASESTIVADPVPILDSVAPDFDPYEVFVTSRARGATYVGVVRINAVTSASRGERIVSDLLLEHLSTIFKATPETVPPGRLTIPGGRLNGIVSPNSTFPLVSAGEYYLAFFWPDWQGQPELEYLVASAADGTIAFSQDDQAISTQKIVSLIDSLHSIKGDAQ